MFNPTRLAIARRRRGLSISALSDRVRVSTKSISSYENGHSQPSGEILDRIANKLDFPIEFFSMPEPADISEQSVSFRARTKVAAYKKASALSCASMAVDVSRWIEERFETAKAQVPTLTNMSQHLGSGRSVKDIEAAADTVRARWGLGSGPIGNMVHLLESRGIRVFSLTGEASEVDAFSFWLADRPFVLLNTLKSGERGRFDAAHELGHLVLHSEVDGGKSRDLEREADQFASAFLMPESDVRSHIDPYASIELILRAKRRWKVAAMALTYRLRELELLSDWVYRETCVNLSRQGYRSAEPGGIDRESSQLFKKIHTASRKRSFFNDLARDINVSRADLDQILFGLTMLPMDGGGETSPRPVKKFHIVD